VLYIVGLDKLALFSGDACDRRSTAGSARAIRQAIRASHREAGTVARRPAADAEPLAAAHRRMP